MVLPIIESLHIVIWISADIVQTILAASRSYYTINSTSFHIYWHYWDVIWFSEWQCRHHHHRILFMWQVSPIIAINPLVWELNMKVNSMLYIQHIKCLFQFSSFKIAAILPPSIPVPHKRLLSKINEKKNHHRIKSRRQQANIWNHFWQNI